MSNYKVNITGIDTSKLKTWPSNKTLEAIKEYQDGKKSMDDIVLNNLKLVLASVQEFKQSKSNLDDLFEVGVLGLIKAINNFDLTKNVMFSTYAVPMIKGEIKRYVRENQSIYKISRQLKEQAYEIMNLQDQYQLEHGEQAPIDYICEKMNMNGFEVKEALDSLSAVSSLSDQLSNDLDISLSDTISDDIDYKEKLNNRISLQKGLDSLNDLEYRIIRKRYYDGLTQMEVAKEFSISQAQVSRIEKGALSSMRKYF
ncbi:MAG TPA: RNA polymerase sigma-G factor [Firmicutes bacterium]|nr:RNA polymerase sigma-G factor [Bacillota bacterium]